MNEVHLFLGPTDRRFGFSVVGGMDEGFSPRIDEMAKGKSSFSLSSFSKKSRFLRVCFGYP